jgi:hypothetical protein
MNCFNHPQSPALAPCPDCGKGLCDACGHAFAIPICQPCNLLRIRTGLKGLRSNFWLIGIGLFIGLWVFISTNSDNQSYFQDFWYRAAIGLCCAGFPVAWKGISSYETAKPGTVVVAGSDAWMIGGIAKIIISFFTGGILFPVTVYRTATAFRSLKAKETETLAMIH